MFSAPVKSSAVILSNNVQVQGSCSEVGSSCSKVDTSDSIFSVMSATAGFPSSLDGGNPSSGSNKFTKSKRPTGGQVYICDVEGCGRTFTSIGYMKYHQGVHSGQRDLKCEFEGCDRKFAWPAHLKYHLMTHTGSRLYKCSVNGCSKSFYTSQRLNVHKRTHTGERPFLCTEEGCDRSFTTAGNLKNHLRVHTGDRPFVCPSDGCGKRFAEQSSLKKHSLVHTGEKPFVCKLCGRTFSQSGSRNVHMKRRHSDQLSDDFGDEEFDDSPGFEIHVEEQDPSFCSDQRVLILHRSEEDLLQIKDEDSTTEEDTPSSDAVMSQSNANVIVLAQPQDILGMANGYHFADADVQEEIVFGDTTTLPSGLDPDQFIRPHHH